MNNTEYFRQDNTEGFTDEQLDEMNEEFKIQTTDEMDWQQRKHIGEKIPSKY